MGTEAGSEWGLGVILGQGLEGAVWASLRARATASRTENFFGPPKDEIENVTHHKQTNSAECNIRRVFEVTPF